jgi:hypothetical protein
MIPNPDFEEYYGCDYDLFTADVNTVLTHWTRRLNRPARYFNTDCLSDPISDYYQASDLIVPQHGNGYLAQGNFYQGAAFNINMEYSQVKLITAIEKDKQYFLRYYISPAFPTSPNISNHGIYFSNIFVVEPPPVFGGTFNGALMVDPQLHQDTFNPGPWGQWNKLSYCFTADSSYNVLTFGVFFNDPSEIQAEFTPAPGSLPYTAYDNFYLAEIDPELKLDAIAGGDTICAGECITLSTNHSLIDGTWQWLLPGSDLGASTDSVVTACYPQPGTYDVDVLVDHCIGQYQNHFPKAVTVVAPVSYQPPWTDTLVCPGTAVGIDLGATGYAVTWLDDGSHAAVRQFGQPGSYAFSLSNGFCEETYELTVEHTHPLLHEAVAGMACPGGGFSFNGHLYEVPGTYADTIQDAQGCDSVAFSINFSHYTPLPLPITGALALCEGSSTVLQAEPDGHTGLLWSNGATAPSINIAESGIYTLTALDPNGCEVSDTVQVTAWAVPQVTAGSLLDTLFKVGLALPVQYSGEIASYGWAPTGPLDCGECPYPLLVLPQEGEYTVTVTGAGGCTATAAVQVSFEDSKVYIPNVVANHPTVDGNGVLYAQGNNDFTYSLWVFDRWGGLRYQADGLRANDIGGGWQPGGRFQPGVYAWMIIFEENGKKRVLAGDVTVL